MREIKLRAYGINPSKSESKIMWYTKKIQGVIALFDGKNRYRDFNISNKDDIFMQYIWLKDKNKKEIYNSDLLKDDEGRIFEVVPDDRFAQTGYRILCLKNKSEKDHVKIGRCVDFYSWMLSEEENYLEVVGNKYENQNLIAEVK